MMKTGWSIEHEQVNPWIKFGFNQSKTERVTEDHNEGVKQFACIRISLQGCEKNKKKENKFPCIVMESMKYGIGSASMNASDDGIKPNLVRESYIH